MLVNLVLPVVLAAFVAFTEYLHSIYFIVPKLLTFPTPSCMFIVMHPPHVVLKCIIFHFFHVPI